MGGWNDRQADRWNARDSGQRFWGLLSIVPHEIEWGWKLRWEPMASGGGLLILYGWPLAGEEPAAPLYRGSPPLGACLRHSQRPASCPRPSPGHTRDQRSWPRRSDPRQPGFPSSGSPGRCALAAWCPLYAAPRSALPASVLLPWKTRSPLFFSLVFPECLLATVHI